MCANSEGSGETARMRRLSPEPSLVSYVISTKISCAGSNLLSIPVEPAAVIIQTSSIVTSMSGRKSVGTSEIYILDELYRS